jgi:hypothetical protein
MEKKEYTREELLEICERAFVPEEKWEDRDIKEVVYNANQESINSLKLQLRLIESQLNREWGNAKNETN